MQRARKLASNAVIAGGKGRQQDNASQMPGWAGLAAHRKSGTDSPENAVPV